MNIFSLSYLIFCVFLMMLNFQTRAVSLEEWNQFDSYERENLIAQGELEGEENYFSDIEEGSFKDLVLEASSYALENIQTEGMENDLWNQEMIVMIGGPELYEVETYKIGKEIVAMVFYFFQNGGATKDHSDAETKYYDSVEEAKADGIDTNADVSWSAKAIISIQNGKFSEITFDAYNEGGFSWSGW